MFSHNRYPETATAIAYENQGFFEQAQSTYEQVGKKLAARISLIQTKPSCWFNILSQHFLEQRVQLTSTLHVSDDAG